MHKDLVPYLPKDGVANASCAAQGPVFVNLQTGKVGVYTPDPKKKIYVEPWAERGRVSGGVYAVRGSAYLPFAGQGGPLSPFRAVEEHRRYLPNGVSPNPADPRDGKALVTNSLADALAARRDPRVTPVGAAAQDHARSLAPPPLGPPLPERAGQAGPQQPGPAAALQAARKGAPVVESGEPYFDNDGDEEAPNEPTGQTAVT